MSELDLRQLQQMVYSLRDELEKSVANTEREVQKERAKSADEIRLRNINMRQMNCYSTHK
jgi:hypothetical protein